ncbi:Acetyl esterase/lipase [Algoriphagus halophilus]|uniref:Acetyl esterase/lipase n=2 Tax=Algoriphagus halophilus TaxID=226505 RepID=A0A1N6GMM1_9BACT|nr:Acetyl esterase/lipase [Algoriphagus halophilus]
MVMIKNFFAIRFLVALAIPLLFFSCSSDSDDPVLEPIVAMDIYDEPYGSDEDNSMDIFLPEGRTKESTPVFVYIHGGAWNSGDKSEILAFRTLLEYSFPGYAIVSLNYSLYDLGNGSGQFPAQENDIIDAINYIASKTDDWNVSDELILAGASAGGHLALLHSYKHPEIGNIQAVMALFPPTDLISLYDFNTLTQQGLQLLLDGTPENKETAYLESSPINYVSSTSVPTVFFHGTEDVVVPISQSELLESKLKEAGVSYYYEAIPGQGHGFGLSTYPIIIQKAADFINSEQ